jgi:homoserine kinase
MKEFSIATAPCSTANIGPGFDVFGLALDALYDKIKITRHPTHNSDKVIMSILKTDGLSIPTLAEQNTAGLVIRKMMAEFSITDTLKVEVTKGIPAGYGMGSSAASAVAAAIAFDGLYELKIEKNKLIEYAAEGEIASAGAKHYDNVAASLLGGFVICRTTNDKHEFIRIEPPEDLVLAVAIPLIDVPKKKTEIARSVVPNVVPLKSLVYNVSGAAMIVAGLTLKDVYMMTRGIDDVVVEPARKHLIPGYDNIKHNALSAGALAVTISGAGPAMIAFMAKERALEKKVIAAMAEGFALTNTKSRTFICRPSPGAMVL